MKRYGFYLAALLIALLVFRKSNAQPPHPDSVEIRKQDSVARLINEKMTLSRPMVDSALIRMQSRLTFKEYTTNINYILAFIDELFQVWLDDNRKRK